MKIGDEGGGKNDEDNENNEDARIGEASGSLRLELLCEDVA